MDETCPRTVALNVAATTSRNKLITYINKSNPKPRPWKGHQRSRKNEEDEATRTESPTVTGNNTTSKTNDEILIVSIMKAETTKPNNQPRQNKNVEMKNDGSNDEENYNDPTIIVTVVPPKTNDENEKLYQNSSTRSTPNRSSYTNKTKNNPHKRNS